MIRASSQSAALLSRRSLMLSLALAPIPALLSCRSMGTPGGAPPRMDAADRQILGFVETYNSTVRLERNLPGARELAQTGRIAAGFDAADLSLLTSALYLQARAGLAAARPFNDVDVRRVLSDAAAPARYGRTFMETTLAEAKARAAAEPDYARALGRPLPQGFRCIDEDGFEIFTGSLCVLLALRGIITLLFVFL